MKFHLETRALPTDAFAPLSGCYDGGLAFDTARLLASTGLEVRIFNENGNQVFQYRKAVATAYAHSTKRTSSTAARTNPSTSAETGSEKARGAAA